MKKTIKLLVGLLIGSYANAQNPQLQNWFISPTRIDMPIGTPPGLTSLGALAPVANMVANGIYAKGSLPASNQLLFYVTDGEVYDYNNTRIGFIPYGGSEVVIVPFDDNDIVTNCQNKYNVFTISGGTFGSSCLFKTVVDMNSYSLSTTLIDNVASSTEFGSLAVSNVTANNVRYLYFLSGSGFPVSNGGLIKKWNINNDGSVSIPSTPSNPVLFPLSSVTIPLAGMEIFARELDLSPDGKWLAWGSFHPSSVIERFHLIHLDGNGDFDQTSLPYNEAYRQFSITGAFFDNTVSGFRGVEFYQGSAGNIKLFMGAGDNGLFLVNIPLPPLGNPINFTQVTGSFPDFGHSQIELSHNGYMYASSPFAGAVITNIGAFNPSVLTPAMTLGAGSPSFSLSNPPKATYSLLPTYPSSNLYTLPDQIDGENYGGILSSPITTVLTKNTIVFNTGTDTWSYGVGSNPWDVISPDPVQVIKELRISNTSNLKIDGMTFKFSPEAKVIIDKGSSLTLDNFALLTSDYLAHPCNTPYTWVGVEVRGDKNLNQFTSANQGRLTLLNNSTIEYAQWGGRAWNSDLKIATGGIITASNSTFRNNKIGVEFNPYDNFYVFPSLFQKSYTNLSSFNNCVFEADGTYPFNDAPTHVMINRCWGIVFRTCTLRVANANNLISMTSIGIRTLDGGFTVSNNSEFTNLWHGIDAAGISSNRPFYVFQSTFNENATGIYANRIDNMAVQSNTFTIGGNLNPSALVQNGIAMRSCSGFSIEDNHFNGSANNVLQSSTRGIFNFYSGSADNVIYRNYFNGLNFGNYANFINRDLSNPTIQGLQYLCNTNTANIEYDFYISTPGIRTK